MGVAFLNGPNGYPILNAHVGVSVDRARQLAAAAPKHQLTCCTEMFQELGAQAVVTVPLVLAGRSIGTLALGSANAELPNGWDQLTAVLAGPVAQAVVLADTVAELSASETRFRGIAESTGDAIFVTSANGEVSYLNGVAEQLLGLRPADVIGRPLDDIVPFVRSATREGCVVRPDGRQCHVSVTVQRLAFSGAVANYVYVLRDLSEAIQIKNLAYLANHDPLTGLFNRRRFEEDLEARLAESRRHGTHGGLLVIDLDRFKAINDEFGHLAGDAVLCAIADTLRRNTRDSDTVARIGGDEFVVLVNHENAAGVDACASKLSDHIARVSVPFETATLSIGASIGVALFPEHATAQALFLAADAALYRSKRFEPPRIAGESPASRSQS